MSGSDIGSLDLHAGPDLVNAAERSALLSNAARLEAALPGSSSRIDRLVGALGAPSFELWPRRVLVTGIESSSGSTMRILFRGRLRALDFCSRHILGSADYDRTPLPGPVGCDVMVVDHPLAPLMARRPALRVPPWVRQTCEVAPGWAETLARMPLSLRKRLAQQLAPGRYTVTLQTSAAAKADFYRLLLRPFVEKRFGATAILPSESAFLRQARGCAVLSLLLDGDRVGAVVLERRGSTLFIAKSGMSIERSVRYRSDLLDYFCFLVAQLLRCSRLDFGVSRPHLDDGVLANKAKWRPRLDAGSAFKGFIGIELMRRSPATLGFLRRNGFLEQQGSEFVVRRLEPPTPPGAHERAALVELAARSGVRAIALEPISAFAVES